MKKEEYRQVEIKGNEMPIILEFPQKTDNEKCIKNEIKDILFNILNEYLEKSS